MPRPFRSSHGIPRIERPVNAVRMARKCLVNGRVDDFETSEQARSVIVSPIYMQDAANAIQALEEP